MAAGSINVQITANAAGFLTAVNQAQQATQQLSTSSNQLGQSLAQAGQQASSAGAGIAHGASDLLISEQVGH
jgi:hypothetical protein